MNSLSKKLVYFSFKRTLASLYVRYPKSEPDKLTIDFDYPYKLNSYKHFSFLRDKREQLSVFLSKLKSKMNIELQKSLKKKLKTEELSSLLVNHTAIVNKTTNLTIDDFDLPLQDIFMDSCILRIDKYDYNVIINSPIIHWVKLPKVILSKCPLFPNISMEYSNIEDLNYEWFISPDKIKWKMVGCEYIFTVESSYINQFLKVKCICPKTNQFIEKISGDVIIDCPKQTAMEARWKYTENYIENQSEFRLLSYNLLANIYSESVTAKDLIFRHCPAEFLCMDYRKGLIIKEISNYHTDVFCLQEVDCNIFQNFLRPYFSINDYDCLFQQKDIESMEGQAIFWRRAKFKLIEDISIKSLSKAVLDDEMICFSQIRDLIRKSSDLLRQWMELKQCMVGCVLQSIDNRNKLIVANTHLYFRPDAELFRCLQIATILIRIEYFKIKYPFSKIIVAGDFNASRNNSTIDLVLNGSVSQRNILSDPNLNISLGHDLSLKSACQAEFTNYTLDFNSELDYIFYESSGLLCQQTVPLPSVTDVTSLQALPNKEFPSDHLALIADFRFKD